jgi:hypothetical protein
MTDPTKKYKTLDSLVKHYKPLTFRFMGVPLKERLPYSTSLLLPLVMGYVQLKASLGLKVSYFDLRLSLTPEQRKIGDLRFLTYCAKESAGDTPDAPRMRRGHCLLFKLRYWPELSYIHSVLFSPQTPKHPDQPKVDAYLLRWGYMLSVNPSFVELVNGASYDTALYALENLQ